MATSAKSLLAALSSDDSDYRIDDSDVIHVCVSGDYVAYSWFFFN